MPENTVVPARSLLRGFRRAAIIAIIASLVLAALLGIFALLGGGFGDVLAQVLLTTLTVAAFGTTALCHLAIVNRRLRVVGFVGIAASAGAAVSALVLIWFTGAWTDGAVGWWKALELFAIAAVSLAQANLLLLLAGRKQPLIRIALAVTLASIAVAAVMIALPIITDGQVPGYPTADAYWRIFGVVAILDALGTIALPILGLVLRGPGAARPELPADAAPHPLTLALAPELSTRLDDAAAAAGVSREQFAVEALEKALDGVAAR